jgi:predicted transcriptional regulator
VNASRLMVVEREKLVGVIALKDMMKLLSLKLDLEE